MKLKGIWITICLIVVSGVCATSYTKQYTSETAAMRSLEAAESVPQTVMGRSAGTPELSAETFAAAVAEDEAAAAPQMEAAAFAEVEEAAADTAISKAMQDLQDLDEQIARSHTGDQDTTTNSMKAAAENERKLWDAQLDKILDKLEQKLPAEEKEQLFSAQREWMRDRENTAVTVSQKQSGGALQELEYNLSIKATTRTRAYELAKQYEEILSEAE